MLLHRRLDAAFALANVETAKETPFILICLKFREKVLQRLRLQILDIERTESRRIHHIGALFHEKQF